MGESHDSYWKLRPPAPTTADERCSCPGSPEIMLQPRLSLNPLACIACNLEVPPERIGFSEALAEELHFFQCFYDCFYYLWLDSREFETWAAEQLADPSSPVNQRGLALVVKLGVYRRAYYWWFQDESADGFAPLSHCPACRAPLSERGWVNVCEPCAIVAARQPQPG